MAIEDPLKIKFIPGFTGHDGRLTAPVPAVSNVPEWYRSLSRFDKSNDDITLGVKNNIGADKLLAVVEQATTPFQQVHTANLYQYRQSVKGKIYASPTLVIIGKVVALHEKYAWLQNALSSEEYFKPVEDFQFEALMDQSLVKDK